MSTGNSTRAAAAFRAVEALIVIALLGASGCTSVRSTAGTLEGTAWQVTAINGRATPGSDMYRISFDKGQIGGRFGCNQFGGPYEIGRDRLIVGQTASTLIGCPEPAATHEAQGFRILGRPMAMEWSSDRRLTLGNSSGSISLEQIG